VLVGATGGAEEIHYWETCLFSHEKLQGGHVRAGIGCYLHWTRKQRSTQPGTKEEHELLLQLLE